VAFIGLVTPEQFWREQPPGRGVSFAAGKKCLLIHLDIHCQPRLPLGDSTASDSQDAALSLCSQGSCLLVRTETYIWCNSRHHVLHVSPHEYSFGYFILTRSCYIAQAILELEIFLPQPQECWDYRCAPLHTALLLTF
jgi:hypothetical protein